MHAVKISLLLACFWAIPANAADVAAGGQKAATCQGCHGANGKSSSAQWPNLAAQQPAYIVKQLQAFKSGSRKNPMMGGMAAALSDAEMANLAAFYAAQPAVKAGGDASLAKVGAAKAAMCLGCHGANAEGNGQVPRLAGQHPAYLATQLAHFKAKERDSGHMQAIAGGLSDEDMKALAAYFGSL